MLADPMSKRKQAREMLMEPYDVTGYEEGSKKSKKKKGKKKKVAKKKTAKKKRRSRMS
jgi:hypothetical protein